MNQSCFGYSLKTFFIPRELKFTKCGIVIRKVVTSSPTNEKERKEAKRYLQKENFVAGKSMGVLRGS